jgi:ABC-type multidrug transport system fused ATPase/permease subunit
MEENFIPDTEIEATTKVAKAHKFVTALPDGFNTTVGEQGVQLSGGQK